MDLKLCLGIADVIDWNSRLLNLFAASRQYCKRQKQTVIKAEIILFKYLFFFITMACLFIDSSFLNLYFRGIA